MAAPGLIDRHRGLEGAGPKDRRLGQVIQRTLHSLHARRDHCDLLAETVNLVDGARVSAEPGLQQSLHLMAKCAAKGGDERQHANQRSLAAPARTNRRSDEDKIAVAVVIL